MIHENGDQRLWPEAIKRYRDFSSLNHQMPFQLACYILQISSILRTAVRLGLVVLDLTTNLKLLIS